MLRKISLLLIVLSLPVLLSFSQNQLPAGKAMPDSIAQITVNEFLVAVNSGKREAMQDFIALRYDQNTLNRIPLFALASSNMSFYYETGGLGYELNTVCVSEKRLFTAELFNKLTDAKVKLEITFSGELSFKINGFIEMKLVPPTIEKDKVKQLSDDEIINRVDVCLKKLEADEEFSGAVLIAKNGEILIKKAIGESSKSYEIPNRTDTKFNLASVGKIFTGMAITQLAEQGKLSFDDPVGKYVSADWLNPEISKKIQIKHLLTHTSGLGDYFGDVNKQCAIPFFRELEDYKSLVVDDTLMFEPGTNFSYSNTGMLLLGVVIEEITHEKYFDYLRKNIFEPAGMTNTDGFDKDRPVKNLATGYTKMYENGEVYWNNHQYTRIMKGSPSGGIYSTVDDLFKYDMAIRSNKLLSPDYSRILYAGRPELNTPYHSYGFFVSEGVAGRVASHQGDGRGVNCQFKMYLDSGYTIIVLSNYSQPSANIVTNVIEQLIINVL